MWIAAQIIWSCKSLMSSYWDLILFVVLSNLSWDLRLLRSLLKRKRRCIWDYKGLYFRRNIWRTGKLKLSAICCIVPSLSLCLCVDGPAVVLGAPGSPLQLQCSDVNRDYVFLSWIPPSADGAAAVQGYFIERWSIIHDVLLTVALILREIPAASCCFWG